METGDPTGKRAGTLPKGSQATSLLFKSGGKSPENPSTGQNRRLHERGALKEDSLGRLRRSRHPKIGHKIRHAHVDLMADGGNHRNGATKDGPGHILPVVDHQVFRRPSPPSQNHDIDPGQMGNFRKGAEKIRGRLGSLNPRRNDHDRNKTVLLVADPKKIPDGRSLGRGDQGHLPGEAGDGTLPLGRKRALLRQKIPNPGKFLKEQSKTRRAHPVDNNLDLAPGFIVGEATPEKNLEPLRRLKGKTSGGGAKHHSPEAGHRISDCKIVMARGLGELHIRQLAREGDRPGKQPVDPLSDRAGELGNGIDDLVFRKGLPLHYTLSRSATAVSPGQTSRRRRAERTLARRPSSGSDNVRSRAQNRVSPSPTRKGRGTCVRYR
jgi:hypothetical protein